MELAHLSWPQNCERLHQTVSSKCISAQSTLGGGSEVTYRRTMYDWHASEREVHAFYTPCSMTIPCPFGIEILMKGNLERRFNKHNLQISNSSRSLKTMIVQSPWASFPPLICRCRTLHRWETQSMTCHKERIIWQSLTARKNELFISALAKIREGKKKVWLIGRKSFTLSTYFQARTYWHDLCSSPLSPQIWKCILKVPKNFGLLQVSKYGLTSVLPNSCMIVGAQKEHDCSLII